MLNVNNSIVRDEISNHQFLADKIPDITTIKTQDRKQTNKNS